MVKVRHLVSEETLMAGWRHHVKKKGFGLDRIEFLFAPLFFLSGLLFLVFGDKQDFHAVVIPCALLGVVLLASPLLGRWKLKRTMRGSPDLNTTVDWEFSERGLCVRGEGFESTWGWGRIHEIMVRSDGLLIYPQTDQFSWLPKSSFGSEAAFEEAVVLVHENLPQSAERPQEAKRTSARG